MTRIQGSKINGPQKPKQVIWIQIEEVPVFVGNSHVEGDQSHKPFTKLLLMLGVGAKKNLKMYKKFSFMATYSFQLLPHYNSYFMCDKSLRRFWLMLENSLSRYTRILQEWGRDTESLCT